MLDTSVAGLSSFVVMCKTCVISSVISSKTKEITENTLTRSLHKKCDTVKMNNTRNTNHIHTLKPSIIYFSKEYKSCWAENLRGGCLISQWPWMSTSFEFVASQFVSFIPLKYSCSNLHLLPWRSAASSCANNEPGGHTVPIR